MFGFNGAGGGGGGERDLICSRMQADHALRRCAQLCLAPIQQGGSSSAGLHIPYPAVSLLPWCQIGLQKIIFLQLEPGFQSWITSCHNLHKSFTLTLSRAGFFGAPVGRGGGGAQSAPPP